MADVADKPSAGGSEQSGGSDVRGQPDGDTPTVTHGGSVLPSDVLPEQLRGLPANQIKYLLTNMVTATQNTAKENRQLKERLEALEKGGKPAPKGRESKAVELDDTPGEKPLEELILEDPESAIAAVIQKRFGKDISQLQQGFGESVMHTLRAEIPDFREHEESIREILEESDTPVTKDNVMGAYLMALGQQQFVSRRQESLKADSMDKANADTSDTAKKRELSVLQREVAKGLGMTEDEYIAEQDKWESGTFDIKVPTGQAKAEAK